MTRALEPDAVRLLNAMGIDVWHARRPAGPEPSSRVEVDASPAAHAHAQDEAPARAARAVLEDARVAGARSGTSTAGAPARSVPEATAARERPAASGVAPFSVLCLSKAGALLLIEPADPRAARRFAADLLAAATGVWGGETQQLRFEWPQPGIAPTADAVARALGAFVGKQLADSDGALVLVGAEVADRLAPGTLPADCLLLPPIDALMTDGSLKRALWQKVGSRRA
ncbi:MAG: hypothetical protein AB7I04_14615 [Pseudomonadales bacterium]